MDMQESKREDVLILSISGELMGGEEADKFQDRIYTAIREGNINIVVDMERIKWMNSAGLGRLMACLTTLRGSGGDLRLARISERVKRPLVVTKLDKVIQVYPSLDEAAESFGSGG